MAATARAAKKPTPGPRLEPGAVTFEQMRAGAELYWPGLGGLVADQWREWNELLFDGALRPVPMVLSRMSSVHGHWFPLLDGSASQRVGTEGQFLQGARGYHQPRKLDEGVRREDLLRGMMYRLSEQDGKARPSTNSREWCHLVMVLHRRLTGNRIWAAPEYEKTEPAVDLGKGLYRPERRTVVQDNDPDTDEQSLPKHIIAGWPRTMMDLGRITQD